MHTPIHALRFLALLISAVFPTVGICDVTSTPPRTLSVEVVESSLLVPTRVTYEWTEKGLEVKGRIEKSRDRYGRILGHVEIELLDGQGRVLSRHSEALLHFSPRRKDPDWASFRALIATVPPDSVQLRLRHAAGTRH